MKHIYHIQVNDTMTPAKVMLSDRGAMEIVDVLKAIVKSDPDALCEITDGDTGEILYHNYDEWMIRNSKKHNVHYWDSIDGIIEECIHLVSKMSMIEMEEANIDDSFYDYGLVGEVRDRIISTLEKIGGEFPFVDENY